MNLFTVQLELGPETRAMIEKVATSSTMQFEFGPKTLETITSVFAKDDADGEGVLRKGAKAALGKR